MQGMIWKEKKREKVFEDKWDVRLYEEPHKLKHLLWRHEESDHSRIDEQTHNEKSDYMFWLC